ncbi:MAG: UDP-4-amino-4,6-dideoxy-N-acetyl-beta-L-altrosamine transaminase [Elusimicrobia bacterium]|nr:UDP-4-amino-4,6-dideoxy-N-acetyl-beta-L-altrosamine transaminase [Elusimicrobiota bacterium]
MTIRIPYGRQTIDDSDVRAVSEALRSDWLTQGPKVEEFEKALADYCGARHAVAFSNGTAALQGAYAAAGLAAGDEFITSPLTFAATATAGLWQGATPVFADIDEATGNLDPQACARAITPRTRALVPVDYAGRPADLDAFRALAKKHGLLLIEDACHALGASCGGRRVGALSDMTVFSFHPVKSITTGEGGAVLTDDAGLRDKLAAFRQHGIRRGEDWLYYVESMALNYRLTDMQSALGLSQLKRLDSFVARRRAIAARYQKAFSGWSEVETETSPVDGSAWHLYVLRLRGAAAAKRKEIFQALRLAGIGVQVHYIPVYRHPFYEKLGYPRGLCPKAESLYERIISLPMYPTLTPAQQDEVVAALRRILDGLYADRASR